MCVITSFSLLFVVVVMLWLCDVELISAWASMSKVSHNNFVALLCGRSFIEILVSKARVVTTSKTPPFLIADDPGCAEEVRLTYRYLDIRRNPIKDSLILRNQVMQYTRNYLNGLQFVEVRTLFFFFFFFWCHCRQIAVYRDRDLTSIIYVRHTPIFKLCEINRLRPLC